MAGESAQAKAHRQREKAARLNEAAARWEQGAAGEIATAAVLRELEADDWTVLHDVRWPRRPFANIDHVAIGNGQVYVIDSKNWSGSITVTGGTLRQNGRARQRELTGAAEAAKAVAALVPTLPPSAVHPVLCLVRDEWVAERFGDIQVCSTQNVVAMLRARKAEGSASVHNDLLRQLVDALTRQAVRPARAASKPTKVKAGRASTPSRAARRRTSKPGRTALGAVLGLGVASVLVVNPSVVTAISSSFADAFVGVLLPDDPPPADGATKDKSKRQDTKDAQKTKRRHPQ